MGEEWARDGVQLSPVVFVDHEMGEYQANKERGQVGPEKPQAFV
jgi:hypothetical protein